MGRTRALYLGATKLHYAVDRAVADYDYCVVCSKVIPEHKRVGATTCSKRCLGRIDTLRRRGKSPDGQWRGPAPHHGGKE